MSTTNSTALMQRPMRRVQMNKPASVDAEQLRHDDLAQCFEGRRQAVDFNALPPEATCNNFATGYCRRVDADAGSARREWGCQ